MKISTTATRKPDILDLPVADRPYWADLADLPEVEEAIKDPLNRAHFIAYNTWRVAQLSKPGTPAGNPLAAHKAFNEGFDAGWKAGQP